MHRTGLFLLTALVALPVGAQQLEIHHIDVGQGDATLVVTPNGSTLLIDAGIDGQGDEVAAFLQGRSITQLDAFLVTHYDADHLGGVDTMIDSGITVDSWFDRGEKLHLRPATLDPDSEFSQYDSLAVNETRLMPGATIDLDPEVTITVIASNCHVRGAIGHYPLTGCEENDFSIALLISYEGFNYFIGGDLTMRVEERIVEQAALGDIDVYKVSHHGSATSSSPAFLELIRPEVAIISNGSASCFNHPRQSVLDNLGAITGIVIYQTNRLKDEHLDQCRSGAIVGGNVADANIADPETDDPDGHISVGVSGGSYVVSLPARGTSRTFPID